MSDPVRVFHWWGELVRSFQMTPTDARSVVYQNQDAPHDMFDADHRGRCYECNPGDIKTIAWIGLHIEPSYLIRHPEWVAETICYECNRVIRHNETCSRSAHPFAYALLTDSVRFDTAFDEVYRR